jgi:hypothetical protein
MQNWFDIEQTLVGPHEWKRAVGRHLPNRYVPRTQTAGNAGFLGGLVTLFWFLCPKCACGGYSG